MTLDLSASNPMTLSAENYINRIWIGFIVKRSTRDTTRDTTHDATRDATCDGTRDATRDASVEVLQTHLEFPAAPFSGIREAEDDDEDIPREKPEM